MLSGSMSSDAAKISGFEEDSDNSIGRSFSSVSIDSNTTLGEKKRPISVVQTALCKPLKRNCIRRVVCKARGLSRQHNPDTAYFEIPPNAPHGMLLTCSQEECKESGRKFRYCQVCNMPVAKRNFLLRHGHGMFQTSKELKEEVDEVCDSLLREKSCIPCDTSIVPKYPHRRVVSFESWKRKEEKPLDEKEREWLELLHLRPSDADEFKMSSWLEKVRHISGVNLDKMNLSTMPLKKKISPHPSEGSDTALNEEKNDFISWATEVPTVCVTDTREYESLFGDVDIETFFGIDKCGNGLEVQN